MFDVVLMFCCAVCVNVLFCVLFFFMRGLQTGFLPTAHSILTVGSHIKSRMFFVGMLSNKHLYGHVRFVLTYTCCISMDKSLL